MYVNGRRCHLLAAPFGKVTVQLPRFRCVSCAHIERCITWSPHCRSTPELDQLRAHLSALMPCRVAADVLRHLLPADVGLSPEKLRAYTLKIGEQLCDMLSLCRLKREHFYCKFKGRRLFSRVPSSRLLFCGS